MKPCGFASGSTNHTTGRAEAPQICRLAILDKHKRAIETCDITRAEDCPIGRYIEDKTQDKHREEGWLR